MNLNETTNLKEYREAGGDARGCARRAQKTSAAEWRLDWACMNTVLMGSGTVCSGRL